MQLRKARLCIDCEEIHDQWQCPICASETFAFLTQWMPAPERRKRPRLPTGDLARLAALGEEKEDGGAVAFLNSLVRWTRRARGHLEAIGIL